MFLTSPVQARFNIKNAINDLHVGLVM